MAERPVRRRGRPPAGGREAILEAATVLLRERGIARLTTREVAQLAGVSEASIFYHYRDRAGLLKAVFEHGVTPLVDMAQAISGPDRIGVLTRLGEAIEQFLGQALPIVAASQADTALRDELADYMSEKQLGPHRGVEMVGAYLRAEQEAGRVRADVDPQAAAMLFVGTCYFLAAQRQMPVHGSHKLPAMEDAVAALDAMLAP